MPLKRGKNHTHLIMSKKDKNKNNVNEQLNNYLSDLQLMYSNLRGFHWNIRGARFFELHTLLEQWYNDVNLKIDEIAERIQSLGGTPAHSLRFYLEHAGIKEAKNTTDAEKILEQLIDGYTHLLNTERNLLKLSADFDDEATNSLMSEYISQHEKLLWMLNAARKQ